MSMLLPPKNSALASIAPVARDDSGNFRGASVVVVPGHGITEPEILEAMVCREGLSLASDLLLREVRIVSD
jgi:hypothetical protein